MIKETYGRVRGEGVHFRVITIVSMLLSALVSFR